MISSLSHVRIDPLPPSAGSRAIVEPTTFGMTFTDRMFSQRYDSDRGWHEATIGPLQPITLDPAAAVFHYSQEIFEGTKAYRRSDGRVGLFRPGENAKRFNRSAVRMAMPEVDVDTHVAAITELVRLEERWVPRSDGASLYIRPVMIATEPTLLVRPSRSYLHYIVLSPVGPYFTHGFAPVSVYIETDYVRAAPGGTGDAKTGGNYAASLAASENAHRLGYQQVLWLDAAERRYVEEVGAMNIAFVYGTHIRTPALSGSILPGVTRDSVVRLAPDLGFTIREERIDVSEIVADLERGAITEVFGMGTAAVIAPVGRLAYRERPFTVNGGEPGPVTKTLFAALTDIQYGRAADPYGWTIVVGE